MSNSVESLAKGGTDVQDPLPETNWFWRRVFTFTLSLVSVAFIWFGLAALNSMQDADKVYRVTRYMIGVHILLITYYMLAPSAEQMVKLIQSARLLQAGFPARQTATANTPPAGRDYCQEDEEPPEDDYAPRSRT